jgi:phosphatidylglycerophosphatase C
MDHQLLYHHLYGVKKHLVLFDFDGTITTRDTFLEFIKFYHGTLRFYLGFVMISPWMALMILKVVPNYKAKEKALKWFFRGERADEFKAKCTRFCDQIVPTLVRPKALAKLEEYKASGAKVIVISASAENWVQPWCEKHNIECLATRLEIVDNKITGRISGFNCYGPEKENRIRACYDLKDYDDITAYGDSRGDIEMLALAQQQYYKPFRT